MYSLHVVGQRIKVRILASGLFVEGAVLNYWRALKFNNPKTEYPNRKAVNTGPHVETLTWWWSQVLSFVLIITVSQWLITIKTVAFIEVPNWTCMAETVLPVSEFLILPCVLCEVAGVALVDVFYSHCF